jgi:hypothetical protein
VQECVQEFAESCGITFEKCDPVFCVLDAILQEARNEISKECNFDFINDIKKGYIDTYGNFMCSSYQCTSNAKEELIKVLSVNNTNIEDLSEATQYFLSEIEITQDDVNAINKD